MQRTDKKEVLKKLTCKLPLLQPSLPTTLAGQGRHHVHVLVFK